jgi:hypothetical protein
VDRVEYPLHGIPNSHVVNVLTRSAAVTRLRSVAEAPGFTPAVQQNCVYADEADRGAERAESRPGAE